MISNFSEQGENRMAYPTKIKASPLTTGIYNAETEYFSRKMSIHDLIRPS